MTYLHALTNMLGWTLLQFLWQGALVAVLFALTMAITKRASARARYAIACGALGVMALLPVATLCVHLRALMKTTSAIAITGETFDIGDSSSQLLLQGTPRAANAVEKDSNAEAVGASSAPLHRWAGEHFAPLLPWAVVFWAAGVFILLVRFGGGWMAVRRLRQHSTLATTHAWQATLDRLACELRVSPPVRLCQSALVEVPTVIGWLRPVVLIPARALHALTPPQLRALLAHELAHIKRYDYLVNLLQTIVETLLFYHPAVWWVSRRVRIEREHACDDLAISATGDVLLYARALTELEQLRHDEDEYAQLALAADGGSLMKRIQRLVRIHQRQPAPEPSAAPFVASIITLLACLTIAAGAPTTWLTAAKETAEARPATTSAVPSRQVAVTFVGFPSNHLYDIGRLTNKTRKLMRSLAANKIEAIGFVNESRLYKGNGATDEARVALLREWLDAGHELGNETFKHTNLYKVSLDEFKAEVLRGEQIMSGLARERGKRLRYFSYPYLNTGANLETKTAAEAFLRERGYQIHPVTIDNMDWLFSKAYVEALRRDDEAAMARIRTEYVPYMERMFEFIEGYARDVVGREFPQVLMLTAGALNADCFDDLALMMKRRGYSFVTMEQAIRDEAYNLPDTYTGARGDSWIARWAVTKGMEYKDSEENLPPLMQAYFDDFLAEQKANKAGKK